MASKIAIAPKVHALFFVLMIFIKLFLNFLWYFWPHEVYDNGTDEKSRPKSVIIIKDKLGLICAKLSSRWAT